MASQTYVNQSTKLNNDLNTWASFISQISQIITQFNENVQYVQDQIDNINLSIASLEEKVRKMVEDSSSITINDYIKPTKTEVVLKNSVDRLYKAIIGISSNVDTIYVFSNRAVPGLTFAGKDVSKGKIYSFTGAETGSSFILESHNILKTGEIILTFTDQPEINDSSIIANVTVKIDNTWQAQPIQIPPSILNTVGEFSKAVSTINAATSVQSTNTYASSIEKFSQFKTQ